MSNENNDSSIFLDEPSSRPIPKTNKKNVAMTD